MSDSSWRVCSTCRKPLDFRATYYECSVSTCNRSRTALFFCSVPCWDAHLPTARHRDAWAIEKTAPTRAEWEADAADAPKPEPSPERRRTVVKPESSTELPQDILIVASKLKKYVKARSDMNTSDAVMRALSEYVRDVCNEAIRHAARDGRKTVLDRDVYAVRRR